MYNVVMSLNVQGTSQATSLMSACTRGEKWKSSYSIQKEKQIVN